MTASERAAAIRQAVRAIKRGSFASYGEVARRAGLPGRARLVGQVLRDSGDQARLPWHRVTGAGGRIAFPAGSKHAP
jgi:methylated-DNA-protein-cysteine methyltransferase-like protein